MRTIIFGLLIALATGCQIPTVDKPLGTRWDVSEAAELNGWWRQEDPESDLFRISVSKTGDIVFGTLFLNDDDGRFVAHTTRCAFTHLQSRKFLYIECEDESSSEKRFAFALIVEFGSDTLVTASPKNNVFIEMVEAGQLGGEIRGQLEESDGAEKDTRWPFITADAEQFIAAIESRGIDKCFDMDEPTKYTRIARAEQ